MQYECGRILSSSTAAYNRNLSHWCWQEFMHLRAIIQNYYYTSFVKTCLDQNFVLSFERLKSIHMCFTTVNHFLEDRTFTCWLGGNLLSGKCSNLIHCVIFDYMILFTIAHCCYMATIYKLTPLKNFFRIFKKLLLFYYLNQFK